jgi:hypothetical protein
LKGKFISIYFRDRPSKNGPPIDSKNDHKRSHIKNHHPNLLLLTGMRLLPPSEMGAPFPNPGFILDLL